MVFWDFDVSKKVVCKELNINKLEGICNMISVFWL